MGRPEKSKFMGERLRQGAGVIAEYVQGYIDGQLPCILNTTRHEPVSCQRELNKE
jgi:hypothetical protein